MLPSFSRLSVYALAPAKAPNRQKPPIRKTPRYQRGMPIGMMEGNDDMAVEDFQQASAPQGRWESYYPQDVIPDLTPSEGGDHLYPNLTHSLLQAMGDRGTLYHLELAKESAGLVVPSTEMLDAARNNVTAQLEFAQDHRSLLPPAWLGYQMRSGEMFYIGPRIHETTGNTVYAASDIRIAWCVYMGMPLLKAGVSWEDFKKQMVAWARLQEKKRVRDEAIRAEDIAFEQAVKIKVMEIMNIDEDGYASKMTQNDPYLIQMAKIAKKALLQEAKIAKANAKRARKDEVDAAQALAKQEKEDARQARQQAQAQAKQEKEDARQARQQAQAQARQEKKDAKDAKVMDAVSKAVEYMVGKLEKDAQKETDRLKAMQEAKEKRMSELQEKLRMSSEEVNKMSPQEIANALRRRTYEIKKDDARREQEERQEWIKQFIENLDILSHSALRLREDDDEGGHKGDLNEPLLEDVKKVLDQAKDANAPDDDLARGLMSELDGLSGMENTFDRLQKEGDVNIEETTQSQLISLWEEQEAELQKAGLKSDSKLAEYARDRVENEIIALASFMRGQQLRRCKLEFELARSIHATNETIELGSMFDLTENIKAAKGAGKKTTVEADLQEEGLMTSSKFQSVNGQLQATFCTTGFVATSMVSWAQVRTVLANLTLAALSDKDQAAKEKAVSMVLSFYDTHLNGSVEEWCAEYIDADDEGEGEEFEHENVQGGIVQGGETEYALAKMQHSIFATEKDKSALKDFDDFYSESSKDPWVKGQFAKYEEMAKEEHDEQMYTLLMNGGITMNELVHENQKRAANGTESLYPPDKIEGLREYWMDLFAAVRRGDHQLSDLDKNEFNDEPLIPVYYIGLFEDTSKFPTEEEFELMLEQPYGEYAAEIEKVRADGVKFYRAKRNMRSEEEELEEDVDVDMGDMITEELQQTSEARTSSPPPPKVVPKKVPPKRRGNKAIAAANIALVDAFIEAKRSIGSMSACVARY